MVKLLTAHGWIKTRGGKGSHIKMEKQGERRGTYLKVLISDIFEEVKKRDY
ncbi:hypothetical protein GO782_00215 [Staphylococcus aureus]|nr:hypothetical protein [Staphylococcus aureus]